MQTLLRDDNGSVHVLEGEVGGRPLQLVYLRGHRASLLWDTGCARDPDGFIVPQIREAGGDPAALTWILNSHTDLDHTGGNHRMKQIAPGVKLAAGDADREAAADPRALVRLRYDAYRHDHAIAYDEAEMGRILEQAGALEPLDLTLVGGEHIFLSDDWAIEIIALPGHARGHLGLLDTAHRALYGADAMHGALYRGLDGSPKLPPTYLHVDDYLNTLRLIEHLPIDTYVGSHWPIMHGAAIGQFCAESRAFVALADRLVIEQVRQQPQTLRELCLTLGAQLGDWPHTPALDLELMFALEGHVSRAVERGWLRATRNEEGVYVYAIAE